MEAVTDAELVNQYVETGKLQYCDTLVRRHLGKVRAMIHAMVLNEADADELTQEVFCRAVAGLGGYSGRAAFSTWLHRIALNTTYSFLRRRGRNPVELREALPEQVAVRYGQPDERAMGSERGDQIAAALASLTPPLRGAIVQTVLQGMSVREAARVEGCPSATMCWRVHQARKLLRRRLSEVE